MVRVAHLSYITFYLMIVQFTGSVGLKFYWRYHHHMTSGASIANPYNICTCKVLQG